MRGRWHLYIGLVMATLVMHACHEEFSFRRDHPGYFDQLSAGGEMPADSAAYFHRVDSAFALLDRPGPGDNWERHHFLFTFEYEYRHNLPAARLYADSMLLDLPASSSDSSYIDKRAQALFFKGDTYLAERDFAQAFNWYYQARLAISPNASSCSLAEYSDRLAAASYQQGRYIEAADFFKQALRDREACPTQEYTQFAAIQGGYDNVGIAYIRAGLEDSASVYFQNALAYLDQNENRFPDQRHFVAVARAVIYSNQADVALAKKKNREAEDLLKKSIAITELPGSAPQDAGYSRIKLAKIYLAEGRKKPLDSLMPLLDTAARIFRNSELTRGYYALRSQKAASEGLYTEAYHYLTLFDHLRDSINTVNKPIAAIDVQQSLNNINHQYQLEFLQRQNKIKSDYLWLFVVIAMLGVVIFILLLINYRRSRRNLSDLTDLHNTVTQRNNALQQTLSALEHSHQNNNRFMKVVAHDLRGPVGSITSLARMARQGTIAPERFTEMLDAIFESGTKAMSLINGLLSDMEAAGQLTHVEPLNVADVVKYCAELYEHQVQQKKQSISLQTIPAFVNGDREKLWRVFSNLINNAIKFSREGGVIIVTMQIHENNVITAVHDHGIGIPENFKNRIFSSPETLNRQGTSGEASFGLGLAISRQIITLHHGKIWFESMPGQGASFYVSLPLAADQ